MSRIVIRAKYLATLDRNLIEDGCVIVESGKVQAIDTFGALGSPRADHEIDGLLMPGLVNRHTHLELSNLSPPIPKPETFQDWILWIGPQMRGLDLEKSVQAGIDQCLRFGVTEAWDITQNPQITRPILAKSPLRAMSFGECLGIGSRRERFAHLLEKALDVSCVTEKLSIGLSPHAPYTVDENGYAQVFDLAATRGLPVMTHLAENEDEPRFLLNHTGGFAALYAQLGFDPGEAPGFYGSPVEWIRGIKPDTQPVWLAHVNYASDEDLLHLNKMNAKVIYCPRTHSYFGHPPHRWKQILRAGIDVYLGTDSCGSSPNLNLLDDLRLIYRDSFDLPTNLVFGMISKPLVVGAPADLISFPTQTSQPLFEIIHRHEMIPDHVWIDGSLASSSF